MRLDAWRGGWAERSRLERLVALLWIVVIAVCCGRAMTWPHRNSVYPIFSEAGRAWRDGADLYHTGATEPFRYSPFVAASFAPLSLLPDHIGGVLWRFLGLGVYLGAFALWMRQISDGPLVPSHRALLFVLVLPLSVGALNNGQSNLLLIGLLMAACSAAVTGRWNRSNLCIALACLFKVYPLAVGLLLFLIYPRRYWWRLPAAIAVGLLLPFLMQKPSYVAEQFGGWLAHLRDNDRQLLEPTHWYRDFRQVWSLWIAPLDYHAYQIIEIITGVAVAVLCLLRLQFRGPDRRFHALLFSLGCCWMTVFGPATESATYVFLAPSAAWAVLRVIRERPSWIGGCLIFAGYGILVLCQIVDWFPFGRMVHSLGPQPIAGLLLAAGFVTIEWTGAPAPANQAMSLTCPAQAG
jgi:hypothetical protein